MTDFKFTEKVAVDFAAETPVKKRRTREERKASYEQTKERMRNVILKDGGRYVTFPSEPETEHATGLLVGGVEFEKKLYFLYIDKERQIRIMHHGESYKLLREIPASLSVLNYIYNYQRNELKTAIENFFEENEEYKLFTEIAIRPYRRRTAGDGKNRKFQNKKQTNKKEEKKED